jgi:hypothetical protein
MGDGPSAILERCVDGQGTGQLEPRPINVSEVARKFSRPHQLRPRRATSKDISILLSILAAQSRCQMRRDHLG